MMFFDRPGAFLALVGPLIALAGIRALVGLYRSPAIPTQTS
jgi:hypothetical protein